MHGKQLLIKCYAWTIMKTTITHLKACLTNHSNSKWNILFYHLIVIDFFGPSHFLSSLSIESCHTYQNSQHNQKEMLQWNEEDERRSKNPLDRNQQATLLFQSCTIFDCAVEMHARDNKLNVIYMYVSNLSRMFLISWTRKTCLVPTSIIHSFHQNVPTCRIQMNASYK